MMTLISRYSAIMLAIIAMSYGLPAGFDKVFGQEVGNPLLFFSPPQKRFIYRESLGGHRFNYMNEEGTVYSRTDFEYQLPFLYYKNLEKKKLLPVSIDGQSFDKKTIKAGKQGLEIKSHHLDGHHPQIELYPLFNNNPEVAIMPFPEDVFRFTDQAMEFVNADTNRIDTSLTTSFTASLESFGFAFPATVIGGKTTNLKPFDEGFFIRDSKGQVFHLKRVLDKPVIVKTPIDSTLAIKDIIVSENRRKEFYGTIITEQGGLYLISYDNYRLITLPVEKYLPASMDFKLLINPLYKTAITSGPAMVHATTMDSTYKSFRSYDLERHNPVPVLIRVLRDLLFPFQLRFDNPYRGQADVQFKLGGFWSLVGILSAIGLLFLFGRKNRHSPINKSDFALIVFTGFFGLIALFFITKE